MRRCAIRTCAASPKSSTTAWVRLFESIIAAGVETGVFHAVDPVAAAWRLCSLLDGLGLQVVLHQSTMSRAQMGRHVRLAASRELGYEPAIGTNSP